MTDDIDVVLAEEVTNAVDRAVIMYKMGVPLRKIREETGVSYGTLYRELRRRGVVLRRGTARKLSREDRLAIIRLYCCYKWTKYRIAVFLGVSYQTVYRVLRDADCDVACDNKNHYSLNNSVNMVNNDGVVTV